GIDGFKSMTLENNRKCMIWDENKQDLELRQFIRWLIRLRKKHLLAYGFSQSHQYECVHQLS
ncbi:hypothetical protein ACSLOB_29780, partial [Escherichia coli]